MKGIKNVVYNKTIDQYKKKYGKYSSSLLSFSENEIKKYNKYNKVDNYDYLLQGRHWWYINGTYYEARRKVGTKGLKVALPIILSGGAVAGITIGVLNIVKNIQPGEDVTKKYKVTYDAGTGEIGGSSTKTVMEGETINTAPKATKTDHILVGWYLDTLYQKPVTFPYKLTKETTFYAKWEAKADVQTVCISFYDSDPEKGQPAKSIVPSIYIKKGDHFKTEEKHLSIPTKDNHKFVGWFYDNECNKPFDPDNSVDNDLTLYAKYEKNAFTIKLNRNGGDQPDSYLYSVSSLKVEPHASKDGEAFLGWKIKDGDYISYPFTPTSDTELEAQYQAGIPTYNAAFYKDTTTETPFADFSGVPQISSAPEAPTVARKKFVCYKDKSTGEKLNIPKNGGYQLTKNTEFVAEYEDCAFEVKLNAVDHNGNPIIDKTSGKAIQETRIGCSKVENAPAFIVENHTLSKWYDEDNVEVTFPLDITKNTTLHGVYVPSSYNVEFYDDNQLVSRIHNVGNVSSNDLPKITKTNHSVSWKFKDGSGHDFSTNKPLDIVNYLNQLEDDGITLKLHTVWQQTSYDLTLVYPTNVRAAPDNEKLFREITKVKLSDLKEYEYNSQKLMCAGWSLEDPSKVAEPTLINKDFDITQNTKIYAVYKIGVFTLTCNFKDPNDESVEIKRTVTYQEEYNTAKKIKDISKPDTVEVDGQTYKFSHWINSSEEIIKDTFSIVADTTITAIYSKVYTVSVGYIIGTDKYTVTTLSDLLSSVNYDDIKSKMPTDIGGYVLNGKWFYTSDTQTTPKEITDRKNPFLIPDANTVIYFEFVNNSFTVNFYDNNGDLIPNSGLTNIKNGDTITKDKIPTEYESEYRTTFNGWIKYDPDTQTESGDLFKFDNGYLVNDTSDFAFKGVTERPTPATFTISDDDYTNGRAWFTLNEEETHLQYATFNNEPIITNGLYLDRGYKIHTRTDYSLDGWLTKEGETTGRAKFPYSDAKSRTFTAKLTRNAGCCTVLFDAGDGEFTGEEAGKEILRTPVYGTKLSDITISTPVLSEHQFKCWSIYNQATKEYQEIDGNYVFTSNVFLHAKFIEKVDAPKSFTTDNWATVSYWAEQGQKTFETKYGKADDCLNKSKDIVLNGATYSAKVVGVNHDTLKSSTSTKTYKGLFTFCITGSPFKYIYNPSSYTGKSNNWKGSIARNNFLKENGIIYKQINSIVVNHAQTVIKETRLGQNDTSKYNTIEKTEDKFFLFSGTELGITNKSQQLDNVNEGTAYAGFDGTASKLKRNGAYWIRSPYNHEYATTYWGSPENPDGVLGSGSNWINANGVLNTTDSSSNGNNYFGDNERYYIFGFVIGKNAVS